MERPLAPIYPLTLADGAEIFGSFVAEQLVHDLIEKTNSTYLRLDASWWDQPTIRDLSFGGKLFFLTGDICIADDYSPGFILRGVFDRDTGKAYTCQTNGP